MSHILSRLFTISSLVVLITSCQPELSDPGTPGGPGGPGANGADSTRLIRSIRIITSVSNGSFLQENYAYDTVNRKITISWTTDDPDMPAMNGSSAVLSYDTERRLTNIKYNFLPGTTEDHDEKETSIFYDAAGTLQRIEIVQQDGNLQAIPFNRTPLSSGYLLQWNTQNPLPVYNDRTAFFNNEGLCTKVIGCHSQHDPVTGEVINTFQKTDSVIYNATGNVQRSYRINLDSAMGWRTETLVEEIDERFTNGNNLYLQRKLLLGDALLNMPFEEGVDDFRPSISLLGFSLWYELHHYSRFPVKRGKYETLAGFNPYVLTATIDSIGRMKNYDALMFDGSPETIRIDIQYYK